MDEMEKENLIDTEYSLDDILSEFSSGGEVPPKAPESEPVTFSPEEDVLAFAVEDADAPAPAEEPPRTAEKKRIVLEEYDVFADAPPIPSRLIDAVEGTEDESVRSVGDIASMLGLASDEVPVSEGLPITAPEETYVKTEPVYAPEAGDTYAPADYPDPEPEDVAAGEEGDGGEANAHLRSTAERIMGPILSVIALVTIRVKQRIARDKEPERRVEMPEEPPRAPEMSPKKAARLYARQEMPLRLRGLAAGLMTFVLVLITYLSSYGVTLAGALGTDMRVLALVCLLLELTVLLAGADIFIAGLRALLRLTPTAESLVVLSALASILDAVVIAIRGEGESLPFCALAALSMTAAICSARLTTTGLRVSLHTLAQKNAPYVISGEPREEGGSILYKSRLDTEGFVRRSEAPDCAEDAYRVLAPVLIVATVILALLNLILGGSFLHCLSGMLSAAATLGCLMCFALPYAASAVRMRRSGAALAGWAGCREIGKSHCIVITDGDIFPPGTITISGIRILEGARSDKILAYTGSVLAASGSALAGPFTLMMGKNGCTMCQVDGFSCHEGGGLTASIAGEQVYVGSSGFMNLMGIRVPQNLSRSTSVFTAVNGQLMGIFSMNYTALHSVQEALFTLERSRCDTIWAIRDFNITPQLLRKKFKVPAKGLEFPAYADRFRISAHQSGSESIVSAILSREGLGPFVDAAERGWRLYMAARIGTLLSIAGSVAGVILVFLLSRLGVLGMTAPASLMTFMLLWLVPSVLMAWFLKR